MVLVRAALAAAAILAVTPGLARAQTCSFTAGPTALAFGAYNPASTAPTDALGTFTYGCSNARARPVVVSLDTGTARQFRPRQMDRAGEKLNYNLYTTAARTTIFGDGTGGTATVTSQPTGPTHGATVSIYGRIDPGQWVSAGAYGDSITVTLNY